MPGLKKRLVVMIARVAAWDQMIMGAMVQCCPRQRVKGGFSHRVTIIRNGGEVWGRRMGWQWG